MKKCERPVSGMEIISRFRQSVKNDTETWLYLACGLFYLLGIWEHSNGGIYTDIVAVYLNRFCTPMPCVASGLPYINYFVEYPPITGFFIYAMGMLAHLLALPGRPLLTSYYDYSGIFLLIPTILLVSNFVKLADVLGFQQKYKMIFLYFVASPSFVFMLLLNWYVIGVALTVWGLRKFLEASGSELSLGVKARSRSLFSSGLLLGFSALANLLTAIPALGILLFGGGSWKDKVIFLAGIIIAVLGVYVPLVFLNSFPHVYMNSQHALVDYQSFSFPNLNVIFDYLRYQQSWYVEGSWMLAFFNSTSSLRHIVFPSVLAVLTLLVVAKGLHLRRFYKNPTERFRLVLIVGALFTFAFLFSSYVCTPQMNLVLLPFFVLIPFLRRNYWEFLAFEIVNSLVIIWGFSSPLAFLGINLAGPVAFGSPWASPIQFLAVVRSLWIGKYLIYDGLLNWSPSKYILQDETVEMAGLPD
jgi:hypothetical protein